MSEADKQDPSSEAYRTGYRHGQAASAYAMKVLEEDVKAARLEGIRLGLEAAAKVADDGSDRIAGEWREGCRADNYLQGQSDGMDEAATFIRLLDPATIAREAVLDKLASEAQEQGMGYDRNVRYGVEVVRPPSAPLIAKEADQ